MTLNVNYWKTQHLDLIFLETWTRSNLITLVI